MSETQSNPETENQTPKHWLSLDQWSNSPEFQKAAETEFQSSPLRDGADADGGWARREFLKLMGASIAMTSAAGCVRRPVQKIVPYAKQPEEVTHGVANFYTSTWSDGAEVFGLLVKTREGRPIKVEGNPQHPLNEGATSVRAQAHIMSLYDPERLQGPKRNLLNKEKTNKDTIAAKWEEADEAISKQLKKGGVVVLSGSITSPSTRSIVSEFCQAFKAQHVVVDAISHDEIREGGRLSYGDESLPFYRFDEAKVIVSVDADFLGTWIAPTTFTRQFNKGRQDIKKMSKLVSFDSTYSLTGGNADIRVRIKPSQQLTVVMGLAHDIVVKKGAGPFAGVTSAKSALEPFANAQSELHISKEAWNKLVDDLIANRGQSLVVAGGLQTRTAAANSLQVAVNFLNASLGNDGRTVLAGSAHRGSASSHAALTELVEGLNKGRVKTVIIHRTNPAYFAPHSGIVEALKKAEMVIATSDRMDETTGTAHYIIPDHHPMENWGDADGYGGVVAIQQPTIRPLYDTRSFQLSLMSWAYLAEQGPKRLRDHETYYDYLRAFWREEIFPAHGKGRSFDDFWDDMLANGFSAADSFGRSGSARSFKGDALSNVKKTKSSDFELALYPTVMMGDGSMTNISWLHELPDPITKIVWDNYASISMATADKLKIREGDVVEVKVGERSLQLPAHIQPGLHDEVVAIAVGYGRKAAGAVANGVGMNAYELADFSASGSVFAGQTVTLTKTGRKEKLACTQSHHAMDGRKIVAEATLQEFVKDEAANNHKHHVFSMWSGHQYNGHKWGMAVDLNSCTGCSACMVACQSENNIPVVGKKYVLQGREMHWLRLDRYYSGTPADPVAVFQPVMCQHCDNAPCESVCPVMATAHSSEGLNDMVYNRCVGTRYCANNCPYKVRRFNWFNFTKNIPKPQHLALNPDVTVRVRGVMEKCTFCTHRIKDGKIKAKVENRTLKDGDIKTACQQVCPTNAIVFGDTNDPESKVSKIFKTDARSYALLEEFYAAPSVRYMTRIRNNDLASMPGGQHGAAPEHAAAPKEGGHS